MWDVVVIKIVFLLLCPELQKFPFRFVGCDAVCMLY